MNPLGTIRGFAYRSAVILALWSVAGAADVQVNSADHNASNLANETTESETWIARNGSLVVIGYNTSRQAGLLGLGSWTSLSGYAYSTNGGASFTDGGFVPVSTGQLEGDPALAFDSSGNLYYASLYETSTASFIAVSKSTSTSPTVTFANPVSISGVHSTTGGFEDKELIAVDTTGGTYNGRVYVAWTDFVSPFGGNSQIMFAASSSTSPTLAFSATLSLTGSSADDQHGAIPVVGPDGSVYVAWATLTSTATAGSATINLVKSTNGGGTFANPDPTDTNPSKTVASFTSTTGDMSTGTAKVGQSTVSPIRTRSFPYMAVDSTPVGSPTRGNLYVVFQAQPNASSPPRSEIDFTASTDGGKTWSAPRNVTSDLPATIGQDTTTNDNWMPSISVSPVTGHIRILLYSRREDPANQTVRVYEVGSTDAGMTFYNKPYSAGSFVPSVDYDALIATNYMGDYISAYLDGNGLIGAWGDTRNACAPPTGATSPCSPSGRGDQDVWSATESDPTGTDLAITPWGAVTGVGATWQSPDIYVLNSSNAQVNAQLGVVNNLNARIRNLGNVAATGAVVRFRFAPWYASIPDSAFEVIGTATVNVPVGGAPIVVPINWDLTNLSDTNGGIWPAPISSFTHFCVRVDIEYSSDINLSNNAAQSNFVDVTTTSAPVKPLRFIVGNPLRRNAQVQLAVSRVPKEIQGLIKNPTIAFVRGPAPLRVVAPAAETRPTRMTTEIKKVGPVQRIALRTPPLGLKPSELQVATITLPTVPPAVARRLTKDLILDITSEVNGRAVSGFSVLLARAERPAAPRLTPTSLSGQVVSKEIAMAEVPKEAPQRVFELTSALESAQIHAAVTAYLRSREIPVVQNDLTLGLVSSGAVPLTHQQLLNAITPTAGSRIGAETAGVYFVTVKTTRDRGTTGAARVSVSVRILANHSPALDSPLRGVLLPSNGALEQTFMAALTTKLQAR